MAEESELRFLLWDEGIDYTTEAFFLLYPSLKKLREDILHRGVHIEQGYLPLEKGLELASSLNVKVDFNPIEARIRKKGGLYIFNMKSDGGINRGELPRGGTAIPQAICDKYWEFTEGKRVEKLRLKCPWEDYVYQIDMHLDRDHIRAEVEDKRSVLEIVMPIGLNVTDDSRYNARNLAM